MFNQTSRICRNSFKWAHNGIIFLFVSIEIDSIRVCVASIDVVHVCEMRDFYLDCMFLLFNNCLGCVHNMFKMELNSFFLCIKWTWFCCCFFYVQCTLYILHIYINFYIILLLKFLYHRMIFNTLSHFISIQFLSGTTIIFIHIIIIIVIVFFCE